MLFNSVNFAIFLPIVFILYWFVTNKRLKVQNLLLLAASYFFYASWDYRFLYLLIFSTALDYFSGLKIGNSTTPLQKKFWLYLSIIINVGFLCVFKYFNFFTSSFVSFLSAFGLETHTWTLKVILPVGISFYTFHGLSYVLDIYNQRISPEKDFVDYAVFVSFFPLLVAGPIERATHLLPQIKTRREFDYTKAVDGLRQILWGLFKKVVIADTCADYANHIFGNYDAYGGSTLALGALFFTFQIYCDFSGYSDIALGTARLFGIELLRNFAFPYFSRDIAEFWRRWHISLTTWFRDYVYIPLGGNRGSTWLRIRNIFIIFLVSGFWHGANWTFIAWGALNAIYFLPLLLLNKNRSNIDTVAQGRLLPSLKEFTGMLTTFGLTMFAWIFFRSVSVTDALIFIKRLFSPELFRFPDENAFAASHVPLFITFTLLAVFLIVEWLGRDQRYAIASIGAKWYKPVRWTFYYIFMFAILLFLGKEQQFIYFQF